MSWECPYNFECDTGSRCRCQEDADDDRQADEMYLAEIEYNRRQKMEGPANGYRIFR